MAEGRIFRCGSCGHRVEAWDEGEPYYFDPAGRKRYAHHPDPLRDACVGVDDPHLCLACARRFAVDGSDPRPRCPKCASDRVASTWQLEGKPCPRCHEGAFQVEDFLIS